MRINWDLTVVLVILDTLKQDCLASISTNVKLIATTVIRKQNAKTLTEVSYVIAKKALVEMVLFVTKMSVLMAFIIVIPMQLVQTPSQVSAAIVKRGLQGDWKIRTDFSEVFSTLPFGYKKLT